MTVHVFIAFVESVGVVLKKYQMRKESRLVKKCRDVSYLCVISREDKGDREGIPHTHPIP